MCFLCKGELRWETWLSTVGGRSSCWVPESQAMGTSDSAHCARFHHAHQCTLHAVTVVNIIVTCKHSYEWPRSLHCRILPLPHVSRPPKNQDLILTWGFALGPTMHMASAAVTQQSRGRQRPSSGVPCLPSSLLQVLMLPQLNILLSPWLIFPSYNRDGSGTYAIRPLFSWMSHRRT